MTVHPAVLSRMQGVDAFIGSIHACLKRRRILMMRESKKNWGLFLMGTLTGAVIWILWNSREKGKQL